MGDTLLIAAVKTVCRMGEHTEKGDVGPFERREERFRLTRDVQKQKNHPIICLFNLHCSVI